MSEIAKLGCLNHFSAFPGVVFTSSLSVDGCEKSRFVGDETRMQTWRWTELPQMLEVASTAM